jgi:hypothetical protein
VGKRHCSPQEDRGRVANKIRGLGDQIEMAQYIRGRIGMDRSSTALDSMGRIPGYHTRRWPPSALSQGQGNGQPVRACGEGMCLGASAEALQEAESQHGAR